MRKFRSTLRRLTSIFRLLIYSLGILALVFIILSFTSYPYHAYHWLGTANARITSQPDYIVVMGAGGMPGPEGMIRCYYASLAADQFPEATIIVALPADSLGLDDSDHQRMVNEIKSRGIEAERIMSETLGTNTYTQARNIRAMLGNHEASLLIITSPEHMYRCIRTFRKQGFEKTSGIATFEHAFNEELLVEKDDKGRKRKQSDQLLGLRYNMWSYMQYQIIVLREFIAIGWYKMQGYI